MKTIKLSIALILALVSLNAYSQQIIDPAKQKLLSKQGQINAVQFTDNAFELLKQAEPERLYSLIISEVRKTDPNEEADFSSITKAGFVMKPLPAYSFKWNKLSINNSKDNADVLITDSLHLVCIAMKKEKILGLITSGIKNSKWHVMSEIPNPQPSPSNATGSSVKDDIGFVKAIKLAQQYTNDIFTITYTIPTDPLAEYVIGFVYNGKINVITFHDGAAKRFESIDDWIRQDGWLKSYQTALFNK